MKVLITGGAGFIGSHLADAHVARGDQVVVLDDLSTGKEQNLAQIADKVDLQIGSVTDMAAIKAAMEGCERVYHLAAVASVQQSVETPIETNAINFGGTLNVLEAARAHGEIKRVVFASSAAIYGDRSDGAVRESDCPNPQTPYAIEKLQAERYVSIWPKLFGLDTVGLRFFNVFGPRQDPSSPYSGVVSIFADRLLAGKPTTIFGDGEQTRDFVAVNDVIRCLFAAGDTKVGGGEVFNVGRGKSTSLNTLYAEMATVVGSKDAPIYADPRPGDIRHSLAKIGRAQALLGFTAQTSIPDGLKRLVDSIRS